jgi:Secretion system C-terminal sorting domain
MRKIIFILIFGLPIFNVFAFEDLATAEYFWDVDPGYGKATQILVPSNITDEYLIDITTANLSYGSHTLGIRVKAAQNRWSSTLTETVFIHTPSASGNPTLFTAIEYFFDTDLGFGKNKIIQISPKLNLNYEIIDLPIPSNLPIGTQTLQYRIKTGRDQWSSTFSSPIAILPQDASRGIAKVELYFYLNDPGLDRAISIPISPINGKEVAADWNLQLNFDGAGFTLLNFRAKDTQGNWSGLYTSRMEVTLVLAEELLAENKVKIYPNPSKGVFNVEIADGNLQHKILEFDVFDSMGRKVHNQKNLNKNREAHYIIDISDKSNGVYYLRVKGVIHKLSKN